LIKCFFLSLKSNFCPLLSQNSNDFFFLENDVSMKFIKEKPHQNQKNNKPHIQKKSSNTSWWFLFGYGHDYRTVKDVVVVIVC